VLELSLSSPSRGGRRCGQVSRLRRGQNASREGVLETLGRLFPTGAKQNRTTINQEAG
jgi:hypothetical protein